MVIKMNWTALQSKIDHYIYDFVVWSEVLVTDGIKIIVNTIMALSHPLHLLILYA